MGPCRAYLDSSKHPHVATTIQECPWDSNRDSYISTTSTRKHSRVFSLHRASMLKGAPFRPHIASVSQNPCRSLHLMQQLLCLLIRFCIACLRDCCGERWIGAHGLLPLPKKEAFASGWQCACHRRCHGHEDQCKSGVVHPTLAQNPNAIFAP